MLELTVVKLNMCASSSSTDINIKYMNVISLSESTSSHNLDMHLSVTPNHCSTVLEAP